MWVLGIKLGSWYLCSKCSYVPRHFTSFPPKVFLMKVVYSASTFSPRLCWVRCLSPWVQIVICSTQVYTSYPLKCQVRRVAFAIVVLSAISISPSKPWLKRQRHRDVTVCLYFLIFFRKPALSPWSSVFYVSGLLEDPEGLFWRQKWLQTGTS